MAAGSAAERAETGGIEKARARGREVVLTFSMQVRAVRTCRELAVTSFWAEHPLHIICHQHFSRNALVYLELLSSAVLVFVSPPDLPPRRHISNCAFVCPVDPLTLVDWNRRPCSA